jgi:vanadium-dependent haloperoxidase-like protein
MRFRPAKRAFRTPFARAVVIVAILALAPRASWAALPPGNPVQQWDKIAEDVVVGSGAFQNEGLIYMAYVSLAMYNAAVAIEGRYEPYRSPLQAPTGASVDAGVIEAAYTVLRTHSPAQSAALDGWHTEALALIADGAGKVDGRIVGAAAAHEIIDLRAGDGRLTPIGSTSDFPLAEPGPGVWRRTPPFAAPQTPWVGSVQPFILNTSGQFHPAPPPPLTSQRWVDQFNEVKALGAVNSQERTATETMIARFWTANVIRQYNMLARDLATARSLDVVDSARLTAMINAVGADGQIEVMHWKYSYLFWRPVTAIDPTAVTTDGFGPIPGVDDGNDLTVEETGWRPLLPTPNHPEYPGAHGSITSTVAQLLSEYLGTDEIAVDIHGFDPAGPAGNLNAVRHFFTADELREEVVNARIWGGLHYRGSTEAGVDLGRRVAHYDLNHAFRPR